MFHIPGQISELLPQVAAIADDGLEEREPSADGGGAFLESGAERAAVNEDEDLALVAVNGDGLGDLGEIGGNSAQSGLDGGDGGGGGRGGSEDELEAAGVGGEAAGVLPVVGFVRDAEGGEGAVDGVRRWGGWF